jgi:transposase
MNPVVGLDVSKGESQIQAFLDKGKPYRKSFSVLHDLEGLETLLEFLRELEGFTDQKPSVVLEATGHYHTPVVQFLEDYHYLLICYSTDKSWNVSHPVIEQAVNSR